jgi:hypothetical protein
MVICLCLQDEVIILLFVMTCTSKLHGAWVKGWINRILATEITHPPDLLHLRMRLAAQRQVQVSKSRTVAGEFSEQNAHNVSWTLWLSPRQ